jgi:uncharacterized protein
MAATTPICYFGLQSNIRYFRTFPSGPHVKLLVDRFSETPTTHRFTVTPEWWAEAAGCPDPAAEGIASELVVELRGHCMGADLYLEGEASGVLEPACSRCLGRYRQPVREPFRLVLEPAGDRVPADPEGAERLARDGLSLDEELESGWYSGSEIDFGAYIQELIALLLPVQPVCREDCRGLCPRCGVDRNHESCDCADATRGSPFAVLQALRDELAGGKDR